jgi:CheY-like chemotaxis protein
MDAGSILIVEDEQESREFLSELFESKGFRVAEASNGAEAWQFLQQSGRPCIIILDVNMPIMDGRQFRSMQLRDPWLAKIPTVVVSAADPSSIADLGATAVIRKPVDVDALIQVVEANC